MPEEKDNAALVAYFLDELWNKRNVAIIDQLTTEDYVVHIPQGDLLGREALKMVVEDYFERFSFIHVGIVDQTSRHSQVVTRIGWDTALNLRDQSSGEEIDRKIPARGVSIDRIDDGQIVESWNMLDTLYWLFNIQELSRDPAFVRILPAARGCHPLCSGGFTCREGRCVQSHGGG
jgi:predicted SnoaL-like aldol condensation-catalyzing enzyme